MVSKSTEWSQAKKSGDAGTPPMATNPPGGPPSGQPPGPPPGPNDHRITRAGNAVFKSGPLFISSKGIGWTSWKKRWFILTHTSLVFFRSDPSAIPQKGSEVNLTLGGIDLNNSGSVVVKADKKLLTVLFPDGRDGRAFTLKAESLEDLYDWKTALENALAQAPSTGSATGQNGILKNDKAEAANGSVEQLKEKPVKFPVIGRPILLALEDVDGTPSFLEKAIRFIEEHGVQVEGILRQAAYVDDVHRRIREFEQGKTEFSPEEDAHIIADCVKYVIRELPSSPVPASCCNALLEARRTDRGSRVSAMRTAILETFPEPNRKLLQRILMMMQTVASSKNQNRMSTSAVAACMAPLLLRPLLAGECEIETDFNVGGDGSAQLLQAAAAANHAQAIVITLLEEYDKIFGEGSASPEELYSESELSGSGTEEATDDDESYEDDDQDGATPESDAYTDDDLDNASSRSCSESGESGDSVVYKDKMQDVGVGSKSPERNDNSEINQNPSSTSHEKALPQNEDVKDSKNIQNQSENNSSRQVNESAELLVDVSSGTSSEFKLNCQSPKSCLEKSSPVSNESVYGSKRPTVWGRTAARKNLSMESIDGPSDNEVEIQRLEDTKSDLQRKIADEVKGNEILEASLESRKKALHERRLALENDVARLKDQLQKERDKRTAMEAGLGEFNGSFPIPDTIDEKTKVELGEIAQAETDIINLKQKAKDLRVQLSEQLEKNDGFVGDSSNQLHQTSTKLKDKQRDNEAATERLRIKVLVQQEVNKDGAAESDNEKKQESLSFPNKLPPQNQQVDSMHTVTSRSTAPINSRKSGTRSEGSNPTSFALTKLTTRLNFLKERRSQIANELMDKSRGSSQGSEPQQSLQNQEKSQASEIQPVPQSEKGGECESSQSIQNLDKGIGKEGQSVQDSEKFRKSNIYSTHTEDGGQRPETSCLDRGKSEGHMSYESDKSQRLDGQSHNMPTRTFSR
ncbi:rho GTPase-activating protein REN1 isoform X1 [Citrus sinensis]|uniref:rho GTPase-activating protein REN1 isoform X1 n=1 Tax=Citrus sinensis TaxID=2711 RepID=UPI000CED5532|nr:rho GTPase-activating protein REN1 isoform X1 [Citrus sinensis]XP_024040463.1 rho GTPase-activating protein REN1 isoform X1 [Citrus x clementina]XP_052297802.1 rho GTPase-activating protein REN1 isoform X1 [Citrus sinensis]